MAVARDKVPVEVTVPPLRPVPAVILVTDPAVLDTQESTPLPSVCKTWPLEPSAFGSSHTLLAAKVPGALKPT